MLREEIYKVSTRLNFQEIYAAHGLTLEEATYCLHVYRGFAEMGELDRLATTWSVVVLKPTSLKDIGRDYIRVKLDAYMEGWAIKVHDPSYVVQILTDDEPDLYLSNYGKTWFLKRYPDYA